MNRCIFCGSHFVVMSYWYKYKFDYLNMHSAQKTNWHSIELRGYFLFRDAKRYKGTILNLSYKPHNNIVIVKNPFIIDYNVMKNKSVKECIECGKIVPHHVYDKFKRPTKPWKPNAKTGWDNR